MILLSSALNVLCHVVNSLDACCAIGLTSERKESVYIMITLLRAYWKSRRSKSFVKNRGSIWRSV